MRESNPRSDPAPRRRGVVALLGIAVLALTLALGLTTHHDEAAPASAPVELTVIGDASEAVVAAPDGDAILACSFLVLCCVALLLARLRTRRAALRRPIAAPRERRVPRTPSVALFSPVLSLDLLSISRT